MPQFIFMACLVLLAGIGLSIQTGVNIRLQTDWAHDPILAAFISFAVGTVALFFLLLVTRVPAPDFSQKFIWWHWTGGLLGAFMVVLVILFGPRLGAATLFSLIVAGQLIGGLVIDHYGAFGFSHHSVSWIRIAGVFLILTGGLLIRKF